MPATKKTRTYLDTGVLFAAFRGEPDTRIRALTVLSDPAREFVASDYLMLEMLPKAIFFGNQRERGFTKSILTVRSGGLTLQSG